MSEEIRKIVASLPGMNDVNDVCELVKQRVKHGDAAFAADLGIALFNAYGSANTPIWQYRSVFGTILRLVITAGPQHLRDALQLISSSCAGDRERAGHAASLLASNRSAQDLAVVFAGGSSGGAGSEELRACLVHELVLRGEPVDDRSAIAGWATSPHWGHHPLRWLPLSRPTVEADLTLPDYSVHGYSDAIPFGLAYDRRSAREICGGCIVREECARFAAESGEQHGVWGGVTGREREAQRQWSRRGSTVSHRGRATEQSG